MTGVQAFADEDSKAGGAHEGTLVAKVVSLDQVSAEGQYVLLADHPDCGRVFPVQPGVTSATTKASDLSMGAELSIQEDTATWSIAKNDDGTYVVGSNGSFLSLAGGALYSETEAAIAAEPSGDGYILSNGPAYIGVTTQNKQHLITAVDSAKVSMVYIAEVVKEEEPEPLNTGIQIPVLLPNEGFSATITTPDKIYSSTEYVIFAQNAMGEYVAIDREGTASAPLTVNNLAYGYQISSPDNDVTWRVTSHDNSENKAIKYIQSVSNDLLLTGHVSSGVLTSDAALSDFRLVYNGGELSAKLRTDSGTYLTLDGDIFATTEDESKAIDVYFAGL